MPDFDLSVTICSWNTRDELRDCLTSLTQVRGEADFEVIVVENNSADGSGEMVAAEFPQFRLLLQPYNLGFTGGHNLACEERNGRHLFLLNSDTVVHPGAISRLLQCLREHPEAGIFGPKLLNADGSLQYSCRRFPNPVAAMFRNTPLGRLFPKNRFTREYLMTDWDHSQAQEVDWISGAAMLVRGEVIDEIGLFDPAYYMFCEDTDLCWRARRAGFGVFYCPDAQITHLIGVSTSKAPNRMIARFHRSMFRFYVKNQLPEVAPAWRPLMWIVAAAGLTARASMFLAKNQVDRLRRRLAR